MARDGLLIGEVAAKSGVSRKALRLYERTGILLAPRRTVAGYRVYGPETLTTLTFVAQARRLGFHLDEIKEIVQIKRSGRCPSQQGRVECTSRADSIGPALEGLMDDRWRGHLTSGRVASSSSLPPMGPGAIVALRSPGFAMVRRV